MRRLGTACPRGGGTLRRCRKQRFHCRSSIEEMLPLTIAFAYRSLPGPAIPLATRRSRVWMRLGAVPDDRDCAPCARGRRGSRLPLSDTGRESAGGVAAAVLLAGFGRLASTVRIEIPRGVLAVVLRTAHAREDDLVQPRHARGTR